MNRYRALASHRPFLYFLVGGAFSTAAPSTVLIVLILSVNRTYLTGPSPSPSSAALALSALGLAAALPTIASMIFSGTIADRADRRQLMIRVSALALFATAGIGLLLWVAPSSNVGLGSGFTAPVWLVLSLPLWAIVTIASTLFRPAFNASLPKLVATADLGTANSFGFQVAIGLLVVGQFGASAAFAFGGASAAILFPLFYFLAALASLIDMKADLRVPARATRRPFLTDAKEGFQFLARRAALLEITVAALAINFLSAMAFVELGLYSATWVGVSSAVYLGALFAASSVGSGFGAFVINRLGFERRAGRFLAVLVLLQGVSLAGLIVTHSPVVGLVSIFFFGMFPGMFMTVFLATLQATVPNDILARVFAADEVGSYSMVPVGQYAGGLLVVSTGLETTYALAGAGTIAVGLVMLALPGLATLRFVPREGRGPPADRPVSPYVPPDAGEPA